MFTLTIAEILKPSPSPSLRAAEARAAQDLALAPERRARALAILARIPSPPISPVALIRASLHDIRNVERLPDACFDNARRARARLYRDKRALRSAILAPPSPSPLARLLAICDASRAVLAEWDRFNARDLSVILSERESLSALVRKRDARIAWIVARAPEGDWREGEPLPYRVN